MFAEEIYSAAAALCGEESEILGLLCNTAEEQLLGRLKADVDVKNIKALFITAAAMLACDMYIPASGSVKSWSAGQVSVTEEGSSNLRERAELLLTGYIDSGSGFDFIGVMG